MKFTGKRGFIFFLYLSGTILFFAGCNDRIPEEKFRSVYKDLLVAQDSLGRDPEAVTKIKEGLYKKHGITGEQFDQTVRYYKENPKEWETFYTSLIKELEGKVGLRNKH